MTLLLVVVSLVFIMQIVMFFVIRNRKKKEKENNVLLKYNINSPAEAFKKMNDMSIPEEDRMEIERLYNERD